MSSLICVQRLEMKVVLAFQSSYSQGGWSVTPVGQGESVLELNESPNASSFFILPTILGIELIYIILAKADVQKMHENIPVG